MRTYIVPVTSVYDVHPCRMTAETGKATVKFNTTVNDGYDSNVPITNFESRGEREWQEW